MCRLVRNMAVQEDNFSGGAAVRSDDDVRSIWMIVLHESEKVEEENENQVVEQE